VLAQREGSDEQVFEQPYRARPPRHQATLRVDGWIQIVREHGDNDCRHRARASHSQGTVLVWPWPSTSRKTEWAMALA
jgi:hypothetical protein